MKSNLDPVVRKSGEQWLESDALVNAPSAEEFVSDVQYKSGFAALEVSERITRGRLHGEMKGIQEYALTFSKHGARGAGRIHAAGRLGE